MKKTILILFSVLFFVNISFSQKGNDNGSTGGNRTDNNPSQNNNNGGSSGVLGELTKAVFGIYQQSLISKRRNDSFVFGVNIDFDAGLVANSNSSFLNVLPRLRYNYGALSADVRYDYLTGDFTYRNLDALLEFNFVVKNFKASIGQGAMYSFDDNIGYHESYFGIDVKLNGGKILVAPDLRLAYDWNVNKPVNTEIGLKLSYRILDISFADIYLSGGAGYRYYKDEDFSKITGGLDFVF